MNNWAIIGSEGFIAKRHKKAIEEVGDKILLTCDSNRLTNPDFYDFEKMRASNQWKRVSHVAICVPNYLHADLVKACLEDGKKVLCEKPLTIYGDYEGLEDVKVVLQLRCNPEVQKLRETIEQDSDVFIDVQTYREKEYWDGWKGNPLKSGGILYNMGIHYIDLLIYLLGEPLEILEAKTDFKYHAHGKVRFEKGVGNYNINLSKEPCETERSILVNGKLSDVEGATIPLSDSKNQTYLNLHTEVYKNLKEGKGVGLEEAKKSLELVEKLMKNDGTDFL